MKNDLSFRMQEKIVGRILVAYQSKSKEHSIQI